MESNRVLLLVDPDSRRRAAMVDSLTNGILHIEPFEEVHELKVRWPAGHIALVWDDADAIKDLQEFMTNSDRDLLIIGYNTRSDTSKVVKAVLDGALDYLIWPFNFFELQSAMERIEKADGIFGRARRRQAYARARIAVLTKRERQVLELVGSGLSAREIGEYIGISSRTVEVHRDNLVKKIGGSGTWDVIRLAVDAGLLETVER